MPRKSMTIRGIALTAFLGASAIGIAGCTPPMPPDVRAAVAEQHITCQSGSTSVAVPADFTGSMDAVGQALTSTCPEQSATEVTPADPAGVEITASAPTAATITDFQQRNCPTGSVITIPAFAYPVTLAVNVPGLDGLVLTPDAVAGILSGSITAWDDPAIVDANAGMDLSGLAPITVISSTAPSGAVNALTTWLAKEAPSAWADGAVDTLSVGDHADDATGLVDALTSTDASVGVLPVLSAVSAGLAPASLAAYTTNDDGSRGDLIVISPDDTGLAKIGSGATAMTTVETGGITLAPAVSGHPDPATFDLAASKVVLAEDQPMVGWPVVGFGHALVCDAPTDPLPLSFAQYLVRLAGQGSVEAYGLLPLPEPVRVATFDPLKVQVVMPSDGASPLASATSS